MNTLLIQQKMIERGLTQEDVARDCGLERKAIQRILSSKVKRPHKSTIKALANYLKVSPLELIEEKTEISRKKLLEFILTRVNVHAEYDYFIFRNADKLEVKDIKDLVNYYGACLQNLALEQGEINRIEFDDSRFLLYVLKNELNVDKAYNYMNGALTRIKDFISYSRACLKCRPHEACKLLRDKQKREKLFIYPNTIKTLARIKGLEIRDLENQLHTEMGVAISLNMLESRPLEGVTDAKIVNALINILGTKASTILCPEWLR